jgi:hypothetical protein
MVWHHISGVNYMIDRTTQKDEEPTLRVNYIRPSSVPPPLPNLVGPKEVTFASYIHRELRRLTAKVSGERSAQSVIEDRGKFTAYAWVEGLDEDGQYQPMVWVVSFARASKDEAEGELLGRLLEVLC